MKLPKRFDKIISEKQAKIDIKRSALETKVIKIQSSLLAEILKELDLKIKDGAITDSEANYKAISKLDKIYSDFMRLTGIQLAKEISGVTSDIVSKTADYFSLILADDMPKRFEKIIENTAKITDLRLGMSGGQLVRGGVLESFFKSAELGNNLKQVTSKMITSNADLKDYTSQLKDIITGSAEYKGGLERQFSRFGYDLYQQYDAAYNKSLADEFDLKFFAYQGGLIEDSRDFCADHNGKVYSVDEADEWMTWVPADGEYPAGYEIKQKNLYEHPSYMDYPGYDPLIDRGGYNCRHMISYISDELALSIRPDLKK